MNINLPVTRIFNGIVEGIDLKFIDFSTSGTPSCVFTELQRDDYGLNQIQLNPEDIVLDVGANIGMFSIFVKKKFNCKIIAFEPVPINFEHFKQNIILNELSLSDFELHQTAITSIDGGKINIGTPYHNSGGSSVFHTCSELISSCNTETLNKYITKDCKYLKIDCEGGEYEIIPSIIASLNQFSYLGIEYHSFNNQHSPLSLHNIIKKSFNGRLFCQEPTK